MTFYPLIIVSYAFSDKKMLQNSGNIWKLFNLETVLGQHNNLSSLHC